MEAKSKLKAWFEAFRLRTLPLAFSNIFMAGFLAYGHGVFDLYIFALTLLTTLFLQVLSNLANDYGDAASGVDGEGREGPKRMVSSGAITTGEMKKGLITCGLLAFFSGVALVLLAFPGNWFMTTMFVVLGVLAIIAAVKYTMGINPYGYHGLGDLFVFIFFGIVGVCGGFYLYAQTLPPIVIFPAISIGLLSVGVLNINNIRDIESDRRAGKISIPVRIGRPRAVNYHFTLLVMAVLAILAYAIITDAGWQGYLWVMSLPLLVKNAIAVKQNTTPGTLDPYLKQLALATLAFVILTGLGEVLG